jgi:hypothetical protein
MFFRVFDWACAYVKVHTFVFFSFYNFLFLFWKYFFYGVQLCFGLRVTSVSAVFFYADTTTLCSLLCMDAMHV